MFKDANDLFDSILKCWSECCITCIVNTVVKFDFEIEMFVLLTLFTARIKSLLAKLFYIFLVRMLNEPGFFPPS